MRVGCAGQLPLTEFNLNSTQQQCLQPIASKFWSNFIIFVLQHMHTFLGLLQAEFAERVKFICCCNPTDKAIHQPVNNWIKKERLNTTEVKRLRLMGKQVDKLTSTCWQVWISLPIRLSKSLVLLIRLLRLASKDSCKAKLKVSWVFFPFPLQAASDCKQLYQMWRWGHTRLPPDLTGCIWSSDQRRALPNTHTHTHSILSAKHPILLPAEATELSRASASDLDN